CQQHSNWSQLTF
nr:immunoglobulin light chain junction region [Macaca mulatta]